jgi:ubiquinone/menaquinone biosynthesis C-methylase UbiE
MHETFKALSDLCRIRLLAILMRGEFTVQELTSILGTGQSRISHHLKILLDAGLLSVKRQGTWSYYGISDSNSFFTSIREAIELQLVRIPERAADLAAVAGVFETRRKKSQEFFDRHALQWQALSNRLMPLPEYQHLLLMPVAKDSRLLEIGVGTGELIAKLAEIAAVIIGVDHSPAMLAEARRRIPDHLSDRIDLRLGEMAHLPLSDMSVDCAISNMVLHHAADPLAVLAEIRRVLVSGGFLLIADLVRHEQEAAREQLADQWLGFEENELRGWLVAAGFQTVDYSYVNAVQGKAPVFIVRAR